MSPGDNAANADRIAAVSSTTPSPTAPNDVTCRVTPSNAPDGDGDDDGEGDGDTDGDGDGDGEGLVLTRSGERSARCPEVVVDFAFAWKWVQPQSPPRAPEGGATAMLLATRASVTRPSVRFMFLASDGWSSR